jgi:uncharacterized protein involved in exopolysaccharide biosynthesis/Mrp family chromosome partitioning ATPase
MSSLSGPSTSLEQANPGSAPQGPPPGTVRPIPAGNAEQAFFHLDLRRSVQLHRRMVIAFALAGLILGVAYFLLMWRVYLAQAVIYVQPAPPTVLQQNGPPRWPFDSNTYESYIAQQMLNVTGADVLTTALHKLGHGKWWAADESEQAAVEGLRRTIEVTREGTSYQFSIGARDSDPNLAAQIANAVATSYVETATGEQKAGDTQRLTVLSEERDRVQKELTADRSEQEALNKQLGQASIGNGPPDHFDEDIGKIREDLVKARTDHDDAAARYTSVGAASGPSSAALNAAADEVIASDAGLVSMKTSLNERRAVLVSQMANLTPTHPQYKQDAEELAKINASLDAMASDLRAKAASRIQLKLRGDLERAAAVEGQLNAQLRQLTAAAGNATSKLQRASDLVTDITRLQARYATVDEQWRNLMLEDGALGSAFVTTPAVPPLHLAKSGVLRNAVAIVLAGLIFGLMAAVVSHKIDPRIYIAADVEQELGYAPLAQLPDFYEVSDGVAEEHLLRLSTAIEYARKQGNLKSFIFTGTGPGTGVTTLVTRVREMLEAMGRATVLVDASGTPHPAPRSNSAEQQEAGQPGQGLATTQRPSRSSALVQQMAEETETQEESLVLTDTAPLVVSAETEYLVRFVDCAIVVIESGVTTRTQLRDIATALQRLDVGTVGFVLNRVGLEKADPAFRLSVRAIEDHLDAQSRSQARRTVRSQPPAVEETPAQQQTPAKFAADAAPWPAVSWPIAETPVSPAPIMAQEQLFVPTQPSPVPPRTSRTPPAPDPVSPVPNPPTEDPWWLTDLIRPDVRPSRVLPEPAKAAEPQIAAALHSEPAPEPQTVMYPQMPPAPDRRVTLPLESLKIHEVEPLAFANLPPSTPKPVIFEPRVEAPPPPQTTTWSPLPIQPLSGVDTPVKSETQAPDVSDVAPARAHEEVAQEQNPSHLASRFDGLRNLVTVLGLKQTPKTPEPREPEPKFAKKIDRGAEHPLFARAFTPAPDPVSASMASAPPRLVTAQPEFLPPKSHVDPADADGSGDDRSSNRRDRWSGQDEVGILPSRRGQYKRK